jgi:hypothetical protein
LSHLCYPEQNKGLLLSLKLDSSLRSEPIFVSSAELIQCGVLFGQSLFYANEKRSIKEVNGLVHASRRSPERFFNAWESEEDKQETLFIFRSSSGQSQARISQGSIAAGVDTGT